MTNVGVRPGFGPASDRGASGAATREERAAARGARTGARAGTIVVVIASIVSGVSATTSGAGDKWQGKREGAGHYRPVVITPCLIRQDRPSKSVETNSFLAETVSGFVRGEAVRPVITKQSWAVVTSSSVAITMYYNRDCVETNGLYKHLAKGRSAWEPLQRLASPPRPARQLIDAQRVGSGGGPPRDSLVILLDLLLLGVGELVLLDGGVLEVVVG